PTGHRRPRKLPASRRAAGCGLWSRCGWSSTGRGHRRVTVRRGVRALGLLLIVVGVAAVAWALVVWRWQDPFTAIYTHYEQHKLSRAYERRAHAFSVVRAS